LEKKGIAKLTIAVIAIIVIVVAAIFGYYAYTTMFAPKPAEEKVLRIGMPRDVRALDPGIVKTNIEVSVERLIYEPLIRMTLVDGKLETEPWIAESWKPVDEKTWEVKIRKGVKFHNGRELTAKDVAWNLNRVAYWTNITAPKFCLGLLNRFEAIDQYTLRVGADQPVAAGFSYLGETHNLPTACPEEVLKPGFGTERFCGTGPYKCIERIKGERLVFVKNEDYWNKDHPPTFDKIIVKIIPDATARVIALETGEIDYMTHVPPAEVNRLKNKGFEVDVYRHHRNIYYWINTAKPPTDDIRVRLAINYAVDKKTIAKELYFDMVTPADGVFVEGPPGRVMFAEAKNEPMFPYNPEKAKQLLAEAGYGPDNPCPITIWNSIDRYLLDKDLGVAIAGYLNKNGFKVTLEQMEFGSLQGKAMSNCRLVQEGKASPADFPYHVGIYSLAIITMDLDWGLNINWWSKSAESLTFWWVPGRYGTALPKEFDDLYLKQSSTLDTKERYAIMERMQRMIYDAVPYLFMHSESTIAARVPYLKGVTSRAEYYYWYDAYFEKR